MRTTTFSTIFSIFFLSTTFVVLAQQPTPQPQGIQLGNTDVPNGYDIRFPLTVTECEPAFIFYNTTGRTTGAVSIGFVAAEQYNPMFLDIIVPSGVGYLEWFCDIPAGYSFGVWGYHAYYLVVQPGASDSCLIDVTATYPGASYMTTVFQSYTSHSPTNAGPSIVPVLRGSTVPFPVGAFPTNTINPDMNLPTSRRPRPSSTSRSTVTSPSSSRSSLPTPPPRNKNTLSTGVVVGIVTSSVLVVIAFSIIFIRLRTRRMFQPVPVDDHDNPDPTESLPLGRPTSAFTMANRYSAASEMSALGRPVSHRFTYPTNGFPDLRDSYASSTAKGEEYDPYKRDSMDAGQTMTLLGSSSHNRT